MSRGYFCIFTICISLQILAASTSSIPKIATNTCVCGRYITDNLLNIVRGRKMMTKEHPFLALLKVNGHFTCGGTVINSRYVLTAAHCFPEGYNKNDITVVLGAHDRIEPENHSQEFKIDEIKIHEGFKTTPNNGLVNDVTLLKLDQDIVYSDYIRPICLPTTDKIGEKGYVQGWGKTGFYQRTTFEPMQAVLKLMSAQDCTDTPIHPYLVDLPTILCAQSLEADACLGDSGGPLITKANGDTSVLTGIISFGVGCAEPGYPGVYTKVASYLDWIYSNTEDATYCSQVSEQK